MIYIAEAIPHEELEKFRAYYPLLDNFVERLSLYTQKEWAATSIITSYDGTVRTVANGPNHVGNKAIDLTVKGMCPTDMDCNEDFLQLMRSCALAHPEFFVNARWAWEPDHAHGDVNGDPGMYLVVRFHPSYPTNFRRSTLLAEKFVRMGLLRQVDSHLFKFVLE